MSLVPYQQALGVWNNIPLQRRAQIRRAASNVIGMAYRRFRRRRMRRSRGGQLRTRGPTLGQKRKRLGFEPGSATSKRRAVVDDASKVSYGSRTLHTESLIQIPRTSTNDITQRQRDMVYISGIKLCLEFENIQTSSTGNVMVNVAVITPKYSNIAAPAVNDFFRSSSTNSRSRDFDPADMTSLDFACLPINSDDYLIHMHKKFMVWADNNNHMHSNIKKFMKWIPIKRQFRFDNDSGDPTSPTPYLAWWFDGQMINQGTAAGGLTLDVLRTVTLYFREPHS